MKARLRKIAHGIERLAAGPEPLPSWQRLARPVLRRLFGRPRIGAEAIDRLVRALARAPSGPLVPQLEAAVAELERAVRSVERASRLNERVPTAEAGWLWRLYQIVYRAGQLVGSDADQSACQGLAASLQPHQLRPLVDWTPGAPPHPAAQAVDPLLDAARHEFRRIGRKRRFFEAARQLLLEAAAAGDLDGDAVRARRMEIARQIARLDRLQAAGVAADVDLVYQARQARAHGDLQRLTATLTALEESALAAGHTQLGQLVTKALEHLWMGHRHDEATRLASQARSQQQLLGAKARARVLAGYQRAIASLPDVRAKWRGTLREDFFLSLDRYLSADPTGSTLTTAAAVDGCFELGGAVTPVRSLEIDQRLIQVRHPTQDLTLVPARTLSDLQDAMIDDPRAILPSFAAGTLLTRRYLALEDRVTERKGLHNDARIYVLDGSASMMGPRARMRDALLVTELVTLAERLKDPARAGNPVLYYCYFNLEVTAMRRVATEAEAYDAIEEIIGTVRAGGTNIQKALLESFDHIRLARERDPDLVHAQLVLVTDGEAPVDHEAVHRAREAAGEIPIGVSIIALGEENPALRSLAARQRARGERVFYQFMDDGQLEDVQLGRTGLPIHLPPEQGAAAVSSAFDGSLDEIEQCSRQLDVPEMERASVLESAMAEVALPVEEGFTETTRARHEALLKDEVTLANRFLRWFPRTEDGPPVPLAPREQEALDEIGRLLLTVAEVLEVGSPSVLERRSDAIEIMERLLRETSIPPWRYADLLRRRTFRLAGPLASVHAAAGMA